MTKEQRQELQNYMGTYHGVVLTDSEMDIIERIVIGDLSQTEDELKILERGIKKATSSKKAAIDILKKAGILTKNGNLSKRYKTK